MSGSPKRSATGSTLARLVVTLAAALAGFACASPGSTVGQSAPEIIVGQEADRSAVQLVRGQRLTIALAGNPTTGYSWEAVSAPEQVVKQEGAPAFTPQGSALGAGGVYHFTFTGAEVGKARLSLAYRRRFEPGVAPARSFELTVVVTD